MTTKATKLVFQANASTTFNVRMFEIDGQPWFVASDVCRALDLRMEGGTTAHTKKLDVDERRAVPSNLAAGNGRGMAQAILISEPGLYELITKSDKPEAKAFDRWVRHDVLPSIRKTGGYLLNEEARDNAHADDRQGMPLPEAFAQMFDLMMQQQAVTNQLLAERKQAAEAPVEKPKAERRIRKLITALEAADKFDIEAPTPEIGMRASVYCRERGIKYSHRRSAAYGKINVYPTYVFKDMLIVSHDVV